MPAESKKKLKRIIGHLDMDAFFASVEERNHEWLRGKPIVVGADPNGGKGRGVVSTSNYKARAYGIRSAMPISRAWILAKQGQKGGGGEVIFLQPNFSQYQEASSNIFGILKKYSALVEEASIDEAYFDLTCKKTYASAVKIARAIKEEILKKEFLTCSIGIGPNKLIAKIASDMEKPNGLTTVEEEKSATFLEPLSFRVIPGIGPKTEERLLKLGAKNVGDLKAFSAEKLEGFLGKLGREIFMKIRGIDDSPLIQDHEIKSIGEQETFAQDTKDLSFILGRLEKLCRSVHARIVKGGFKGFCTVVVTVRFSDFETVSRSHTLATRDSTHRRFYFEAMKLLSPFLNSQENPKNKPIRLIGVRAEKLF